MIVLLALLFLFREYGTNAAPVIMPFPVPSACNMTLFARDDPPNASHGRSVWNIVWSCLATTFAVTWISVHPNIPRLKERSVHLLKRRVFLMCLALLAPEVMIMWAFKQWRGALEIKEAFNKAHPKSCKSWTMTHAHFFQMNGFKLRTLDQFDDSYSTCYAYRANSDGDEEEWEGVLTFYNFKKLLTAGKITYRDISEEEIEDRSKSDALSKGIALLQISWFILQLIARAHQNLAVTEIELTTAALAGLNSIMYLFWWNKPFAVRCPIVIRTKVLERRFICAGDTEGTVDQEKWTFPDANFDLKAHLYKIASEYVTRVLSTIRKLPDRVRPNLSSFPNALSNAIRAALAPNENAEEPTVRRTVKWIWTCFKSAVNELLYLPYLLMYLPVDAILDPVSILDPSLFSDAKHRTDDEHDMRRTMSMMFYSEYADPIPLVIFSTLSGAAFGSIHCAAWNFDFPSHVDQLLWRMASLTIVGICICIIPGIPLNTFISQKNWDVPRRPESKIWVRIGKRLVETVPAIVYTLARVSLLILSLLALRNLSPSALETVTWTNFIPHI